HFFCAELAVAVAIEIVEPALEVGVPGLVDGLTVDVDVDAQKDRALVAEEDEGGAVAGAHGAAGVRLLGSALREGVGGAQREGRNANGRPKQGGRRSVTDHAMISAMGRAPFSTMRMGRPTLDMFWRVGSMPRARQTVARKSDTVVGRSA